MNPLWTWPLLAASGIVLGLLLGYALLGMLMKTALGRRHLSMFLNWYEKPLPDDMRLLIKNGRWVGHEERADS